MSSPQKPPLAIVKQAGDLPAEISVAYLQAPVNIPMLDVSTNTSLTPQTAKGVRMTLTAYGLVLEKNNVTALIPSTNIKIAVFK